MIPFRETSRTFEIDGSCSRLILVVTPDTDLSRRFLVSELRSAFPDRVVDWYVLSGDSASSSKGDSPLCRRTNAFGEAVKLLFGGRIRAAARNGRDAIRYDWRRLKKEKRLRRYERALIRSMNLKTIEDLSSDRVSHEEISREDLNGVLSSQSSSLIVFSGFCEIHPGWLHNVRSVALWLHQGWAPALRSEEGLAWALYYRYPDYLGVSLELIEPDGGSLTVQRANICVVLREALEELEARGLVCSIEMLKEILWVTVTSGEIEAFEDESKTFPEPRLDSEELRDMVARDLSTDWLAVVYRKS